MKNGGIIGPKNSIVQYRTSGVYNLSEQYSANKSGSWEKAIVIDGLSLWLDASHPNSYPGSGTSWFDLSGNSRNGTIQAGVSYNSAGFFNFNNTTSAYVQLPLITTSITNITMQALVNMPASDGGAIFYNGGSGGYGIGVGGNTFDSVGNEAIGLFQNIRWIDTNTNWGTGWMMVTLQLNATSVPSIYKNTTFIGSYAGAAPATPASTAILGLDGPNGGRSFAGSIAWAVFYNKALSQSEIEQNFNVISGRYGI